MKSIEEYLDDYLDKYNELSIKEELWRLRLTPQEFISEIERVRLYGVEARSIGELNEYHIQRNEEAMIAVMLQNKVTREEFKDQADRIRKSKEEYFAKEASR